jgi:hypothetical protein
MFQMWADGVFNGARGAGRDVFDSRPHASTAKAIMINTASQYPLPNNYPELTRFVQGWGLPDVKQLYNTAQDNGWRMPILVNEDRTLRSGDVAAYNLQVFNSGNWLRATLVYSDPPPALPPDPAVPAIVNNLSIRVVSPGGTEYFGNVGLNAGNWSVPGGSRNNIDNVQNIFIQSAESGNWVIEVSADEINLDGHVETQALDADFALVVTTGGAANSRWTNSGLRFTCDGRERMRINDNGDFLVAGKHRTTPYDGLKFSYSGATKASCEGTNGHFTNASAPVPDQPSTVNPLPASGLTFRNSGNGNGFQIGSDGLLRSTVDAYVIGHAF